MASADAVVVAEPLGPAMSALGERERAFVLAFVDVRNYRVAGAGVGMSGMEAWRLAQRADVGAAILEVARAEVKATSAAAVRLVREVIEDPKAETKDRLKAAAMALDRGGLPAQTEHKVEVVHPMSREEKLRLLVDYAKQTGQDPRSLIGNLVDVLPGDYAVLGEVPRGTAPAEITEI